MDRRPIGIFDSGSGGLTIWKSVTSLLPLESIVYLGDHQYAPYGQKEEEFIRTRTKAAIAYFRLCKVKLIVIACNTATTVGIQEYRKVCPDIPIVGVVPVVKTAGSVSKTKHFAVLSTPATAESAYQKDLIQRFAADCKVVTIGNSRLVELIEEGKTDEQETIQVVRDMLTPLVKSSIDVIVLGCTHFPFVKHHIIQFMGSGILVLDSAGAVARQVERILSAEELSVSENRAATRHVFSTTGDPVVVQKTLSVLLKKPVVVQHVRLNVQ